MDAVYSELLGRVVETYRRALAEGPEARAWLEGRGIRGNLAERFQVGYSTGTLASMTRGDVLERLRRLGLVEADGRDRFRNHVVVPAFDAQGLVVQLAAYAFDGTLEWLFPDESKRTAKHTLRSA
jgi:DNA primase